MKIRWCTALLAVSLLALVAADGPGDDWLRRGNAAFDREDYDEALRCYAEAEARTTDPGAVAFNEAAALYRSDRFPEAERYYRRCLENARGTRRAQTLFNLGNCLLKRADEKNLDAFAQAVKCYEDCLDQPGLSVSLRGRAENNLELARLLWQKARSEDPAKQSGNKQNKEPKTNNGKRQDDSGEDSQKGMQNPQDGKGDAARKDGQKGSDNDKKGAGKGDLSTLPDNEQLVPMTVQETRQLLEEWTERMRQERQARQRLMAPPAGRVKDW
jgi:tetratricopeptide (TPR) repeat protein